MQSAKGISKIEKLENNIIDSVRRFSSAELLLAISRVVKNRPEKETNTSPTAIHSFPFVPAALASFVIRFSNPHRHQDRQISMTDFNRLSDLVFAYLSADPITFDKEIEGEFKSSNPVFVFLRIIASQFLFDVNYFGVTGQSLLLYDKLPKEIDGKKSVPSFDFAHSFRKITGLSVRDFIDIGFVAWTGFGSKTTHGLIRNYFEIARSQGIKLPDDDGVLQLMNCLSADPVRFRNKYDEMKQKDRRYRMYDFNPLFSYPIIRPWSGSHNRHMLMDRMVAPVPELVAYRISTGIYYEMFNCYKEAFSSYFGHLFEAYVGQLLKGSANSQSLISEDDIRLTYPTARGKVPDWIVLDGSTAIIIECKATRFSLPALSTGAEEAVDKSLTQVLSGLKQLYEFMQAVTNKAEGLENIHKCSVVQPLLISFEPLFLINTELFKNHVNGLLEVEGISNFPWRIMSIKELESFQPHLEAGISLAHILSELKSKKHNDVLAECKIKTNKTYKDCMLYKYDQEMYERLGVDDLIVDDNAAPYSTDGEI